MRKEKYEIVEKAWCVDADKFTEPWHHNDSLYYGTKGQAKAEAVSDNDAGELINGKEINFLNIPVIRWKEYDKIKYKGKVISRYQIADKIRAEKIKDLSKDKMYYVQDNRSYVGNAVLWWGIDGRGYVTDLSRAHKYTWDEIQKFDPRDTDIIWESEHVERSIRQYVDMQGLEKENSI